MGQIKISSEFFKNERNNYSDFGFSFFRELFQNSVDAGAKNINIIFEGNTITFADDGCGFSREVLENVYFCLGKTTKNTDQTIGGFGKARILTCFSHKSYSLASKDWVATGSGSEYSVEQSKNWVDGCVVNIDVDNIDKQQREIDMIDKLRRYLALCQLPCRITSNIETINGFNGWLYKRQAARRLSFGTVYVNKSGYLKNTLIVRVDGVAMFTRYLSTPYQIILEIDTNISRAILVSNRDSLSYDASRELDNFVQTIAVDKRVLRDNSRKIHTIGSGVYSTIHKKEKELIEIKERFENETGNVNQVAVAAYSPTSTEFNSRVGTEETEHSGTGLLDKIIISMVILNETNNKIMKLAAYRYNPNNWNYRQGRDTVSLLRMWIIACEYALKALQSIGDVDSVIKWRPGFCFSDDSNAMHYNDGGIDNFLICPVGKNGRMRFRLRNPNSRATLVSEAIHEICHIINKYHDEDFAGLQTLLTSKVFGQFRKIMGDMNSVLIKDKGINSEYIALNKN